MSDDNKNLSDTKPAVIATKTSITISQAQQHLKEVTEFIFSEKFNGKTGYNPYQWAAKHNMAELQQKLDDKSATSTDLEIIMSIPKNEEPKAVSPHMPRSDVFFAAQLAKSKAEKQKAINAFNDEQMRK